MWTETELRFAVLFSLLLCISEVKARGKQVVHRLVFIPRELRPCTPPVGHISDFRVEVFGKHGYGFFAHLGFAGHEPDKTNITEAVMDIERCTGDIHNTNDCEHFARWKFKRVCDLFKMRGQFWTPFVDAITPKLRCPIARGKIYQASNASCDFSSLNLPMSLPLDKYLWTGKYKFVNEEKEAIFCAEMECKFQIVRV